MMKYIKIHGNEERGYQAEIIGVCSGNSLLEIVTWTNEYIVTKRKGYSENPGARNSGLMSYYPPETTVWKIDEITEKHNLKVSALTYWDNPKKKIQIKAPVNFVKAENFTGTIL